MTGKKDLLGKWWRDASQESWRPKVESDSSLEPSKTVISGDDLKLKIFGTILAFLITIFVIKNGTHDVTINFIEGSLNFSPKPSQLSEN
jgi:hypothetical protein